MRIAYVLPRPELSGGNKVVFQHAHLLRGLGHEVNVLGEGPAPDWTRLAVPYHDYARAAPELPEQDLVVATYWPTIRRARELALGPVAHFCQGYEGDLAHLSPQLGEIEAAYSLPLPALTVSPHLGRFLERRFGRQSRLAPPPVDPAFRPRPRLGPARRPWIALPGIFRAEVKDVPTGLHAVARLRAGGLRARLLRYSVLPLEPEEREMLAPDRYLCGVPPEEVARQLRRCDLLILSSREMEGFGLPVLEAMAAGVPVVASRIPSLEGFAGGAAELVPPGDPEAFAAAARALLTRPRAWRRARRRGLRRAGRFRPERVARELDAAFRWAHEAAADAAGAPSLTAGSGRRYHRPASTKTAPIPLHADPEDLRESYRSARPFPHVVLDGLFPDDVLDRVLAEFPKPGEIDWRRFDSPTEKKLGYSYTEPLGESLQRFLTFLSSAPALLFLEALTGIEGLIPDPYFGGAGPHQIEPGGFLKVHADFNWHPKLRLDRRINLLVYLNKDWREEYGGHLELWDREVSRCERRILPVFNRTVVFDTTDVSFHGHPHPLACPEGRTRKSVSLYYYSNGRPEEERSAPHDTIFREIPQER